jgi:hypothetical protein
MIKLDDRTFEEVENIPAGYQIWNIGDNMVNGYLPLCQLYPGTYNIIPHTLKALKIDNDELLKLLRSGAGKGICNLKKCRYYANLKNPKDIYIKRTKEIAQKVLSFFEEYSEDNA